MLDARLRPLIDPALNALAARLAARGVTANALTASGLVLGLAAAALIGAGGYLAGLALIAASRLCDGLDGAVARLNGKTDFGGYLDLVADFAFYGAVPLGFALAAPEQNAVAAAVLLVAFYVNGASFLAFAAVIEKRGLAERERGDKTLHFSAGLAEASETYAAFVAMCLIPGAFGPIALLFALLCFYTAAARVLLAARAFG